MKIPLSWINEFTPLSLQPQGMAQRISVALTEVERVQVIEDETVLEVENKALTHRPDCFSIEGFAREIAAILDTSFHIPAPTQELRSGQILPFAVDVQNTALCPRYSAVVISNVTIKPSPDFIQKRLRLSGVRPINNIVDITNYVMLKTGQPLHAFDYDTLPADKKIIVRNAYPQENFTTLDGVNRTLDTRMLVIADSQKPIAIAGLMGGANTEIGETTKTIILESANFEHFNNRYTSLHLGLRTEASLRFEKGQDPNKTLRALTDALQLYSELADGALASEIIDIFPNPPESKFIEFSLTKLSQRLGVSVTPENIERILTALEFILTKTSADSWKAEIPSFRRDINIEADILEEVARIYGYDRLAPSLPQRSLAPAPVNEEIEFTRKIKNILVRVALDEIYTYTFINPRTWEMFGFDSHALIALKNPLSPELSALRSSLIPSLIDKISINTKTYSEFGFFEINKGILPPPVAGELPIEQKKIAAALYAADRPTYRTLKGVLDTLLSELGMPDTTYQPLDNMTPYEAGECVEILSQGTKLGIMGNLSHMTMQAFSLKGYVTVFELDYEVIKKLAKDNKEYHPLPKYPLLTFDLSFIVDRSITIQKITDTITNAKAAYFKNIDIFDIFADPKLGTDKKSVAIHLIFGSPVQTLSDAQIKPEIEKIERELQQTLSAQLRKE